MFDCYLLIFVCLRDWKSRVKVGWYGEYFVVFVGIFRVEEFRVSYFRLLGVCVLDWGRGIYF